MRCFISRLILPAAVLAVFGCAASGGGSNLQSYRDQLGGATPGDLARKTRPIFERFQFEVEREDSSTTYQAYETRWKNRTPFEDELARGATSARTRLFVRGRARGGGSRGAADVRMVEFTAENMVMLGQATEWTVGFITPNFTEYAKEIGDELRTELQAGIRVY